MSKILLAEDDASVREALVALLESEFHSVCAVENGKEALENHWRLVPDLVVLDIMMPLKSGFDVCREIRASDTATPILFLSAKGEEADKVLGLGLGADDYLAKPFGMREFLARVESLLRRTRLGETQAERLAEHGFRLGTAVVKGVELTLTTAEGRRVALTHREYQLLRLLGRRAGEVVAKETVMDLLWGEGYLPNSRTLEQHLYNLRKKVEGNGFRILTVPRCGLRLERTEA